MTPEQRWVRVGLVALCVGVVFFLFLKARQPAEGPIPCGFKSLSGLPCAFCGGTRATAALLTGDIERALYLNALSVPFLVGLVLVGAASLWELIRGRPAVRWTPLLKHMHKVLPVAFLILVAWWVSHVVTAIQTPKHELVDMEKTIAGKCAEWLREAGR